MPIDPPVRTVNCPTCQHLVEFTPTSRYRPFCSQRCREIDLGAWASERYAIPAAPPPEDDTELTANPVASTAARQ